MPLRATAKSCWERVRPDGENASRVKRGEKSYHAELLHCVQRVQRMKRLSVEELTEAAQEHNIRIQANRRRSAPKSDAEVEGIVGWVHGLFPSGGENQWIADILQEHPILDYITVSRMMAAQYGDGVLRKGGGVVEWRGDDEAGSLAPDIARRIARSLRSNSDSTLGSCR